jgi:hypothetical protein
VARHRASRKLPLIHVRLMAAVRAFRRKKQPPADRVQAGIALALVAEEAANQIRRMQGLLAEARAVVATVTPDDDKQARVLDRLRDRFDREIGQSKAELPPPISTLDELTNLYQ